MHDMTFLRHPVERALSHYGHIMRHAGHCLHAWARELNDFGAFLRDPTLFTYVSNAGAPELRKFLNLILSVAYTALTGIQVTR